MQIKDLLSMMGGLAMFLYGMNSMGVALQKRAGDRLKILLSRLTASRIRGFLLGLIVTAVIQSSSATTVMVVGFVNSGIMTLGQSVYVIMGANVGTAVTSWLLSLTGISGDAWYISMLKPSSFTPVLAFVGIAMLMFCKRDTKKDTAGILLGFSVLMFGMDRMSAAVAPLADSPAFSGILTMFSNPILGVLAGAVFTAIIQSSSAAVGIVQALSLTGTLSYSSAIPIILGENIGTCVTAVLSSIGTTRDARRASMVHLFFNVIGVTVWLSAYWLISALLKPAILSAAATPLGIAIVHTAFKLLCTALLMPFGSFIEKLARLAVPDGKEKEEVPLLDERLFVTPAVALERAHSVLLEMAQLSRKTINESLELLDRYDDKLARSVAEGENLADQYEDKLGTYLVKLSSRNMNMHDSHELNKYLHMIGDFERISDHAVNIMDSAREMRDKQLTFSPVARKELNILIHAVRQALDLALDALLQADLQVAARVEPLEQVIDLLTKSIKNRHIDRLTCGECTIEQGFVLNDLLTNLERVSDHCSNLAVCQIEISHNSMDTHEYLHDVHENQAEFIRLFDEYKHEYALPPLHPASSAPASLSRLAPEQ